MTDKNDIRLSIRGAGGGGGKGGGGGSSSPDEEKDDLSNIQVATIVDLISEGEIEGIVDGFKGIFLNNVPIENENGSLNFPEIEVETRLGWQDQESISFADRVEQIFPVNQFVRRSTGPVTKQITDVNVSAVRFTMTVPRLEEIEDDGDIEGSEVEFRFLALFNNSSDYFELDDKKIKGRTIDPYSQNYIFELPDEYLGDTDIFPIQIRVERITDDSDSAKVVNDLIWTSYTEIINQELSYPNSALVGLRFSAEQFTNIPRRAYRVRGIKVAIPNNGNVDKNTGRIIYDGPWYGQFSQAVWCSDPAWILWDLLTSKRYGLGDHMPYQLLDRYSFYAASQYCNELVPDGFGDEEARFLCNVNIQRIDEAYKVINDLASVFRAMPYWAQGSVTIAQDRPQDPSYTFNLSNVTPEGFNYQNSSQKTKANVALVRYFDMANRDVSYQIAEDRDSIEKYGVIKRQVEAIGCTSPGQAKRVGEWLIYTENNESEVINFTTTLDAGVVVRPGMVIEVSDPVKSGLRRGGRIKSATVNSIEVDNTENTSLTSSDGAKLSVVTPNGTLETRDVSSINGATITVTEDFDLPPNVNSVWSLQTDTVSSSLWRVINVTETEDIKYEISAISYNPGKFDAIENGLKLEKPKDPVLSLEPPLPPKNLTAQGIPYTDPNGVQQIRVLLSWQGSARATSYYVRWRIQNGNWNTRTVASTDIDIYNLVPGIYEFEVFAQGTGGTVSAKSAKLTKSISADQTPTEAVQNFTVAGSAEGQVLLQWNEPTGSNVVNNGFVYIRHTQDVASPTWASALPVTQVSSIFTNALVPALTGVYLARFRSSTGVYSTTTATATFTAPSSLEQTTLSTNRQDPNFTGAKTNTQVRAQGNIATQSNDTLITQAGDNLVGSSSPEDGLTLIDTALGNGEYLFANYVDLGAIFTPTLSRHLLTNSFYESYLIDDQTSLIDTWGLIDLDEPDETNVEVLARATDDDPAGTPTWGAWTPIGISRLSGRAFEFKADLSTKNAAENVTVKELGVSVKLTQRTEIGSVTSSTTVAITFTDAFYQAPLVQVSSGSTLPSGVSYSVGSISQTGFTLTITGAATAYDFTYTAVGIGREI